MNMRILAFTQNVSKNHALSTFYYAFYYKMISMEKQYLQTKSQNEGISYSFSNIHQ